MTERGGHETSVTGELLSATVKRLLMDRIMQGHYQPGERIVELQVSRELGTSQSPVREALRDLAAIGLVTIHSRRGARMREPTGKELADNSLVRSEVDALAARTAAGLIGPATIAELRSAYDDMRRHHASGDHAAVTAADARFHRRIAETSENKAVLQVFQQLEPFARTFVTLMLHHADLGPIIAEHGAIVDALEAGDAERAAHCARTHQLHVSALFRDRFDDADR